jgi:hypothetical protein
MRHTGAIRQVRLLARRFTDGSPAGAGADSQSWLNAHSEAVLELLEANPGIRENYLRLAQGVHRRQSLLHSYNIGIEADRRERDMNKRAARLVGLRLPTDLDEDDSAGGK